jgi:Integrase core domain
MNTALWGQKSICRAWSDFSPPTTPRLPRLLEAADRGHGLDSSSSHLIHDRDAVYGWAFDIRTRAVGIIGVQTPRRAPNANAIAERIVRSIRVECLDHLIVINQRHLIAVLREFTDYYNHDRPHRSLGLTSPVPTQPSECGPVTSRPVLGGLHHALSARRLNWTDYCRPTGRSGRKSSPHATDGTSRLRRLDVEASPSVVPVGRGYHGCQTPPQTFHPNTGSWRWSRTRPSFPWPALP